MKTANEWMDEVRSVIQNDMAIKIVGAPDCVTHAKVMALICRIQANALCMSADICIKQGANADGEDCAKLILAEVDKLEAMDRPNNTSSFGNPALEN